MTEENVKYNLTFTAGSAMLNETHAVAEALVECGGDWDKTKEIESTLGKSLRDYLYKDYYADHQQMYSVKGAKHPIYWLFSSRSSTPTMYTHI